MENNITDHKHEIWCLNRIFEDNSIQKDIEVGETEEYREYRPPPP